MMMGMAVHGYLGKNHQEIDFQNAGGEVNLRELTWVDLHSPTAEERRAVENAFGLALPSREDMREIETTSRLYSEEHTRFMTALVMSRSDTDSPEQTEVTFILTGGSLLTLRHGDPLPFRTVARQLAKAGAHQRDAVFLMLLEAIIDRQADILERIGREADALSREIFAQSNPKSSQELELLDILGTLGRSGDLISRNRESLVSMERLVSYAGLEDLDDQTPSGLAPRLRPVETDVRALMDQIGFLSSKINFMLDATLGLISIEQNNIVKIFTIAATVLLPPTLVCSFYGMNFHNVPGVHQTWGVWLAIALMVISVIIPLVFFRRKGWM